jgi:hypothetical protein
MVPAHGSLVEAPDDASGADGDTSAEVNGLGGRVTQSPTKPPEMPLYKGEPLDPERGPGLGCFWLQVILLGILLVLTPLTVTWNWPTWISATFLIVTLILLLFAGQTVIFLLRLVAADRRTRRTPQSPTARKTVGMIEDEANAAGATRPDSAADEPPAADAAADEPPTVDAAASAPTPTTPVADEATTDDEVPPLA